MDLKDLPPIYEVTSADGTSPSGGWPEVEGHTFDKDEALAYVAAGNSPGSWRTYGYRRLEFTPLPKRTS